MEGKRKPVQRKRTEAMLRWTAYGELWTNAKIKNRQGNRKDLTEPDIKSGGNHERIDYNRT